MSSPPSSSPLIGRLRFPHVPLETSPEVDPQPVAGRDGRLLGGRRDRRQDDAEGKNDRHVSVNAAEAASERGVQKRRSCVNSCMDNADNAWNNRSTRRRTKRDKVRSAWISFAGRIVAQLVGAIATVALGVMVLHRYTSNDAQPPATEPRYDAYAQSGHPNAGVVLESRRRPRRANRPSTLSSSRRRCWACARTHEPGWPIGAALPWATAHPPLPHT